MFFLVPLQCVCVCVPLGIIFFFCKVVIEVLYITWIQILLFIEFLGHSSYDIRKIHLEYKQKYIFVCYSLL